MPGRNPNKFYSFKPTFDTIVAACTKSLRPPYIGVTQGGSSRTNSGARVAATQGATSGERLATVPQGEN